MLTMTQTHDIRKRFFEEGQTISEIARDTGYDRKTIRGRIDKDDWNEERVSVPTEPTFPKLNPFKATIDKWLVEDKKAKRKQRHTAQRVYDRLVEECGSEFNCSYRSVAGYVAIKRQEIFGQRASYLPLEHIAGEAQVDFGKAEFYENSKLCNGHNLNLSFPQSNQGFLQLFRGENQECLFEGLIIIFDHIGGVPTKIWFDNASTMVTNVLKEGKRSLTDGFLRFMEHYRFEAGFCNVASGHEKGNVEGKVGYHRRNMLVPIPCCNSLPSLNQDLLRRCDEDGDREHYRKEGKISELYQADKAALLPLPSVPLDVSRYKTVTTNGYGKFLLHKGLHEYSVSPKHAKKKVLVKITANHVIPLDESHREIVRHVRLYGDVKGQSMDWLPYLTQLSRYPAALKYSQIYHMMPETFQDYLEKCSRSDIGKILQVISLLTERSSFEKATETVSRALLYDAIDADSLLNLHRRIHDSVVDIPIVSVQGKLSALEPVKPNLAAYDERLGRDGDERC